jgi:hypothetical protein
MKWRNGIGSCCHFPLRHGRSVNDQCQEDSSVPEISRFLGIVIAMYYKEHAPPHFHAIYAGQRASFSIQDLRLIEGKLPNRIISLVLEWAFQHREELMRNWERIERKEELKEIEPLV